VSKSVQIPDDTVYDMQDNNVSEGVQIPDDSVYDLQDDVSSINDYSYYRGVGGPPQIKIIGTAESMEEGNVELLSPSSLALTNEGDGKAGKNQNKTMSTAVNLSLGDSDSPKKPPDMKKTRKLSVHRKQGSSWMPKWVSTAPTWLKCFIIFSTAFLVGAVVLVTVALTTALANETATSPATVDYPSASTPNDHLVVSSPPPTSPSGMLPYDTYTGTTEDLVDDDAGNKEHMMSDSMAPSPTANKGPSPAVAESASIGVTPEPTPSTTDPAGQIATPVPTGGGTPTVEADDAVAPVPTAQSSTTTNSDATAAVEQVGSTSAQYDPYVTTFFVTGGRFTNDDLTLLPSQLRSMPVRGGTSFLVHLGDWNSPYATRCDKQSYEDVGNLFSNSSMPVYFIPGDNDYNGTYSKGISWGIVLRPCLRWRHGWT
jgi:hypothetical protein